MVNKGTKCLGCTACAAVCPTRAIAMKPDRDGYTYPVIDGVLCVNCGACDRACPLNGKSENGFPMRAYAAQHCDADVLAESASGGLFTALSDAILARDGAIYGAAFDDAFRVVHIRTTTADERNRCRGSKYVASDLGDIFIRVKEDLEAGVPVLFTGTPCQVDGLRHFLKKDYEGLYLCDLICHGTPSPLAWQAHVQMLEKANRSRMVSYSFRPKDWGWEVHNELSVFENGKRYHSNPRSVLFTTLYYSRLLHRRSCHQCPYSNLERVSDITIADCRGMEKRTSEFVTRDGVSLVLVNSEKGAALLSEVSGTLLCQEIDVQEFMQPPLRTPSTENPARERFWQEFHKNGYWSAVKLIYGKHYVLKYRIKSLLQALGLRH